MMKNIIIPLDVGVSGKVTLLKEDREYGKIQHDQTIVTKNDITASGLAHFLDLIQYANGVSGIDTQHVDRTSTAKIYTGSNYTTLQKTITVTDGWPFGPGPGSATTSSSRYVTGVTNPMQSDGDGTWSQAYTIPTGLVTNNVSQNPGNNVVQFRFEDISVDVYVPRSAEFISGFNSPASAGVEIAEVTTANASVWGTKPNTQNWYWQWDLEFQDNTDLFKLEGINGLWDLILNRKPYSHAGVPGQTHASATNMAIKVFNDNLSSELKEISTATGVSEPYAYQLKWTWVSDSGSGSWEHIVIFNKAQMSQYNGNNTFVLADALYPDNISTKTQASGDTFTYTFTLSLTAS